MNSFVINRVRHSEQFEQLMRKQEKVSQSHQYYGNRWPWQFLLVRSNGSESSKHFVMRNYIIRPETKFNDALLKTRYFISTIMLYILPQILNSEEQGLDQNGWGPWGSGMLGPLLFLWALSIHQKPYILHCNFYQEWGPVGMHTLSLK